MLYIWERLLTLLRTPRGSARLAFELDESLHTALVDRAAEEQRPPRELRPNCSPPGWPACTAPTS